MNAMTYLILALATWRTASILIHEEGPFHLFSRLRWWAGIHGEEIHDGLLAGILSCMWCCSMWVGAAWTLMLYVFPEVAIWLALPFAFSMVSIGCERLLRNE